MGRSWGVAVVLVIGTILMSSCGTGLTQRYEDTEITVKSVHREYTYRVGMQEFAPRPGYEYAIVTIGIRWPNENSSITLENANMVVIDSEGNHYNFAPFISSIDLYSSDSGESEEALRFVVKQGAKLNTLKLKDVSWDIEGIGAQ